MNPSIIPIDENTWRIEDGFVCFFLLAGTEKALLIDSGVSSPNAKAIAEDLTSLPLILLNTHGDGDHVAGNGAFESYYLAQEDYENCRLAERFPESRCLPVTDGDRFDLGGRTIEVLSVPGHTAGSVALLDVERRFLYSGDSVQSGHIFLFGPHRRPEQFAGSLRKLTEAGCRFDKIFPSHDTPELAADYVQKVAAAWDQVLTGAVTPNREALFGTAVDTYTTPACGFYCDPRE